MKNLLSLKNAKIHKNQNSKPLNVLKRLILHFYNPQNWFHVKSWNFHNVQLYPNFLRKTAFFSEPVRRSSTTSRNLLNPPSNSDFYGRRPSSETPPLHAGGSLDKSYASSSNLNVLPIIGKTKMVQASKKAFLQVRNFWRLSPFLLRLPGFLTWYCEYCFTFNTFFKCVSCPSFWCILDTN